MNNKRKHYLEDGYVIYESLISEEKISKILRELEEFKNTNKLYYSQSEHNWRRIKNDIDSYGLLKCSFENFTDLPWARGLSIAGRDILQSEEILGCLKEISGIDDHCMWQNMFFDKSTGTVDHIDTWYLDTDPMGGLIGAWIALEKIDGFGGEFHIFPKSHLSKDTNWIGKSHVEFLEWSRKQAEIFEKKSIFLKKGDVLFWHPSLLHGSSLQKINGFSRKSLTAHYHPSEMLRGGGGKKHIIDMEYEKKLIKQKQSMRKYGYKIFSRSSRRSILKFSFIGLTKYFFGNILNSPKNLMNRSNY